MTEPAGRSGALRAWLRDRYGLDLASLAAFRIALASVILIDLGLRARQLREFYSDSGLVAPELFDQALSRTLPWPHFWSGSLEFQGVLFGLAALFALSMLLGYRTRTATLLSWLMLASLHFRNPVILSYGDTLLRLLLFWAIFLPLGARWSLDRRRTASDGRPELTTPRLLSVGAVAIQLQVAFLYLFSALHKTGPEWTADGSALYYALSVDYQVYPLGVWLLNFPEAMSLLSFSTLYFEMIAPLLLFFPFYTARVRLGTALAFVLFHAGMAFTMRFGLFQLVPCAAMLLFVPGWVWKRWERP